MAKTKITKKEITQNSKVVEKTTSNIDYNIPMKFELGLDKLSNEKLNKVIIVKQNDKELFKFRLNEFMQFWEEVKRGE